MKLDKKIEDLIADRQGIRLELGGGNNPNADTINMDILPLENVDIVWDLEKTPWPLPDNCVRQAFASHVLEHITPHSGDKRLQGLVDLLVEKKLITEAEAESYMGKPGPGFINVMNELWRVMKPRGQFAFVVPYAESHGMFQDPTHINFINETTMFYFDPLHESRLYNFYQPKPWKIVRQYVQRTGLLEVLLEKLSEDARHTKKLNEDIIDDVSGTKAFKVKTVRMS